LLQEVIRFIEKTDVSQSDPNDSELFKKEIRNRFGLGAKTVDLSSKTRK